ncbi:MAG: hypothetical protein M1G31_17960 [Pseudanabaena sp. Salubria-1]|nr:hypothetical protein [Pseudanabaena sp. Salubria-1]
MQPILTELLNLPGIEVENYTKVADRLILEVEAKTTKAGSSGFKGISKSNEKDKLII